MSEDFESAESHLICCAACGIAANDDVKLKKCAACELVRYCGVECQREHRPQHKRACKKRVAELREEILFRQREKILTLRTAPSAAYRYRLIEESLR